MARLPRIGKDRRLPYLSTAWVCAVLALTLPAGALADNLPAVSSVAGPALASQVAVRLNLPATADVGMTADAARLQCTQLRSEMALNSGWGERGIRRMEGEPCSPEALSAIPAAVQLLVPPDLQSGYLRCAEYLAIRESNLVPWAHNRIAYGLFQMLRSYYPLWSGVYNANFGRQNDVLSGGDPLDPVDNARVAIFMLLHGGPGPWRPVPSVCVLPHSNDFTAMINALSS